MTRPYGGRRGAPRPPRHIEEEMEQAGRDGDQARLDAAAGRYAEWLEQHGYRHPAGSQRPDEADR